MKFSSSLSLDKLHKQSIILGEKWIERNLYFIEHLTIPYHISQWTRGLIIPIINQKRECINVLYDNDLLFQQCVDDTAFHFVERKIRAIGGARGNSVSFK